MPNIPEGAQAFVPGETSPLMKGGTPVCSYETAKCRAILAKDPESLNPTLQYLYALIVYPPRYHEAPFMYITAEKTRVTSSILKEMPPELREAAKEYAGKDVFITVYDKNGKSNLGSSDTYADLEQFEAKALQLMREMVGITTEVKVLNDTRKGGSFGGSGCLGVILGGVGLGIGLYGVSKLIS